MFQIKLKRYVVSLTIFCDLNINEIMQEFFLSRKMFNMLDNGVQLY